jgi:dUTP pyrophosphatase
MKIKIVNKSNHELPSYETVNSAGMDLRANIDEPVTLRPLERYLLPTGLFIELPAGYEAQVRPRSGLAFKKGVTVLNTPGTIDADYRGEIKVILVNLGEQEYKVEKGKKIAQIVFSRVECPEIVEVSELDETKRNEGGFGSTGLE